MVELSELRRLERWMTYARWFGCAFGLLAVTIEPNYPDALTQGLAVFIVACLGIGNVFIWSAMRRAKTRPVQERIGAIAYLFDTVFVLGLVWTFAFEEPYITWALVLLLPMEGAMRYRLKGAFASAASVGIFFLLQTWHRGVLLDVPFDVHGYLFVVGLAVLIAGVTGSMADNWYAQSRAFMQQSLALAEIDRLKDRFLAITSHEIRGPLTAIIAGVDTVWRRGDRLTDTQRNRLLEMISRQGHHVSRLVDDLLVTSQLQAGKLALQLDWSELPATIDAALEAASPKRVGHRLEVSVEPLSCRIDSSRVEQVVRNLVENAYKYTPDRSFVRVSARGVDGGVVIEITDDGDGIPPDKRDNLFEAFTRISETSAGKEGVGLGLYIVSQLVSAMDGSIDMTSSSEGTRFQIGIPCSTRRLETPHLDLVTEGADARV